MAGAIPIMTLRFSPFEIPREPQTVPEPRGRSTWRLTRRILLFVLVSLLAAFCFYRLATFTPRPLDSPGTLRPVLNNWFVAFVKLYEQPADAFAAWTKLCLLLLLIPPALAMLDFVSEHGMLRLQGRALYALRSRILFFASIAVSLIVTRLPTFLLYELNPDEGEFLSAAHKLFWDGNFFRSVDTGTSGPLNIYPLMLPAILGLTPDYASSRLLVVIFELCMIWMLHRTVRLLAAEGIARIAVVPVAVALASFHESNLLHYSSERTPLLILAGTLLTSVSILARPGGSTLRLLLLGFLTSAAFFSKMQSVPIALAMSTTAIAYLRVSGHARPLWRVCCLYCAGLLPLPLLNYLLCQTGGVWNDFRMSYLVANFRYTEIQIGFLRDLPMFVQFFLGTPEIGLFLLTFLALGVASVIRHVFPVESQKSEFVRICAACLLVVPALDWLQSGGSQVARGCVAIFALITVPLYFVFFYRVKGFGADPLRWFGVLSTFSIASAIYSLYKPHRYFPHYLVLLIIPVFTAMAWMLIRQFGNEQPAAAAGDFRFRPSAPFAFVFLLVALSVSGSAYVLTTQPREEFERLVPTVRSSESDFIRSLTSAEGQITVWGWAADLYLGSGRPPATRDLNIFYFFTPAADVSSFGRSRFLRDLTRNPPELFVDAVGPASWSVTDRSVYNFEQFPDIASFVSVNYRRLPDYYGQRFYLRLDLAERIRELPMPPTCAAEAIACVAAPLSSHSSDGSYLDVTQKLGPVTMPPHARIDVQFTPAGAQTKDATLFNNEAVPHSFRGFRFQSIGQDRYRLLLGLGNQWALSKSVQIPAGNRASVSIEINDRDVHLRLNGRGFDDMSLPQPMSDAPGPITLGSWIDGYCRFEGTIDFFQIVRVGERTARGN
jgi:hypothetical protein